VGANQIPGHCACARPPETSAGGCRCSAPGVGARRKSGKPSQSAAKRLISRDWGRGGQDHERGPWDVLERSRPMRANDRPTARNAGQASRYLPPAGRVKLSPLTHSLPPTHCLNPAVQGPFSNVVGQPACVQPPPGRLCTQRASVGEWGTSEPRRGRPHACHVGGEVVQHGGTATGFCNGGA